MSEERTRLEAIARDARNARQSIEALRDEEFRAARAKIEEAYRERIADATAAIVAAEKAVRDHIDVVAGHPWEGKRVYRDEHIRERWSQRIIGTKRHEGIVEVRRTGTELPGNISYDMPKLGEAFVRAIGKNGKPGKAIASANWRSSFPDNWKLVEGPSDHSIVENGRGV